MDAAAVSSIRRAAFARQHNPLVNLFGSMPHGIPGRLYVSHGIPSERNATTIIRHVRANDFQRDPSLIDRLDDSALSEFVARQDLAAERSRLNAQIADLNAAKRKSKDAAEKVRIQDNITALKSELQEKKEVQVALPQLGYEMVVPGATFETEFILDGVTDLEITLFLLALDRFASMPMLGGKRNHGLGRIKAQWTVMGRASDERGALRDMGTLAIDGNFGPLRVEGDIARYFSDATLRDGMEKGALNFTEAALVSADASQAA
ncbi:hypothetical protein GALL_472790 [mine drainage metagenome]|uniref:RAMP superfamily protein n=1 Tax=mine drainage metagenome TaxID=410659 RepID=A0A1J5Q0T6_9ZZZZ